MENAKFRQEVLLRHLITPEISPSSNPNFQASSCSGTTLPSINQSDDVVIVAACRTPICKANRGSFKDIPAEDLIQHVLKLGRPVYGSVSFNVVLEKTGTTPHDVGDIVIGNVLAPGFSRGVECRMAAFYAGFPDTVPIKTVIRQCASGLQAVADVAAAIKSGFYDIGIGAGFESLSLDRGVHKYDFNPQVKSRSNQNAKDCLIPMGITSDFVAEQYGVSRLDQDQAELLSHKNATEAAAAGKFNDMIVPVHTKVIDNKIGAEKSLIVSVDEGIRPDSSLSALAKLKPSFKSGGPTTAGNSSQISDGAVLGIFSFSVVEVKPAVMGIGPAFAIPAAVDAAKLKLDDIDLFEINKAFASQYVHCVHKLGQDAETVNVNGGAIALGHPVGATGAHCVATLLHLMKRRGKICRYGVVSMCTGSGMGERQFLSPCSITMVQVNTLNIFHNSLMVKGNNISVYLQFHT